MGKGKNVQLVLSEEDPVQGATISSSNDQSAQVAMQPPQSTKKKSRRVSEAVQSLRQNLDRRYHQQQEGTDRRILPLRRYKVRNQVAAIEGTTPIGEDGDFAPERMSVKNKIEVFEHSESTAPHLPAVMTTRAAPMTPSRRAAVAARKVTSKDGGLNAMIAPAAEGDAGPSSCATPRVWPDLRSKKALFEFGGTSGEDEQDGHMKFMDRLNALETADSRRRSQRLANTIPADETEPVNESVAYPDAEEHVPEPQASAVALRTPTSPRKSARRQSSIEPAIISSTTVKRTINVTQTSDEPGTSVETSLSATQMDIVIAETATEEEHVGVPIEESSKAAQTTKKSSARSKRSDRESTPTESTEHQHQVQDAAAKTPSKSGIRHASPQEKQEEIEKFGLDQSPLKAIPTLLASPVRSSPRLAAAGRSPARRPDLVALPAPPVFASTPLREAHDMDLSSSPTIPRPIFPSVASPARAVKQPATGHNDPGLPPRAPSTATKRKRSTDEQENQTSDNETRVVENLDAASDAPATKDRKRRRFLEIQPTPVKPPATMKAAYAPAEPVSAARKKKVTFGTKQQKKGTTGGRSKRMKEIANPETELWDDKDDASSTSSQLMHTDEQEDKDEETAEEENAGWLMSAWFKAARTIGLR